MLLRVGECLWPSLIQAALKAIAQEHASKSDVSEASLKAEVKEKQEGDDCAATASMDVDSGAAAAVHSQTPENVQFVAAQCLAAVCDRRSVVIDCV
jgi:hypothetical protein